MLNWIVFDIAEDNVTDEYQTFREVTQAIGSIQRQINMYAGIFGAVCAIALGGYALIFGKIDVLEISSARIEEKMVSVESKLASIETTLAKISVDIGDQAKANPTSGGAGTPADKSLIAKFAKTGLLRFLPADRGAALDNETFLKAWAGVEADRKVEIQTDCKNALNEPSSYAFSTLGACATLNQM